MLLREDVCIVLNEREPLKRQMADELETALKGRGYAVSREHPSPVLVELLKRRLPRVVVLDYLLGDEGTVLDLLAVLQEEQQEKAFEVIVWTDEPSVSVAVGAIKLGAYDYIEAPPSPNTARIVQAVEGAISETEDSTNLPPPPPPLVIHNERVKEGISRIRAAASESGGITVIYGPRGCGRNSFAQAFHQARRRPGRLCELDWDLYPYPVEHIFGGHGGSTPLLSCAATVFIDHAEFDDGELMEACSKSLARLESSEAEDAPRLVIGTTLESCARSWARLIHARIVEIPGLADRTADFLPLFQTFAAESKSARLLRQLLDAELLNQAAAWEWPGNIRQLRAAFFEAAAAVESQPAAGGTQFAAALLSAKQMWERFEAAAPAQPPLQQARNTVEACGGNLRAAAARLGTGVPQLRRALGINTGVPAR